MMVLLGFPSNFVGLFIMGLVGFVMGVYKLCHEVFFVRVLSCGLSWVCHVGLIGFVTRNMLVLSLGVCWVWHEDLVGFVIWALLDLS